VRADALRPFADFRAVQQLRSATVSSLAQSRFDWERVINELALVLPDDVWLVNLTGTILPDVEVENGAGLGTREAIEGPALEIVGCARSQDSVAGFVAALEDIDGVTRVGLGSSQLPEQAVEATSAEGGGSGDEDCRTREFITKFEIVAAFDAVPVPATAAGTPGVPAPVTGDEDASQLAGAQAQQSAATASAAQQTGQAQDATQTYLPGN
jgi:hypothetical protein